MEKLFRVRNLVDDEDGERGIKSPVQFPGEVEGIRHTPVRPDPGEEPLRPQFSSQDLEHLLLEVDGEDLAALADPFRKLAGEKSRTATEVEYPLTWLHVTLRKAVRAVEEPPQAGVEVGGTGCGEHLVLVV